MGIAVALLVLLAAFSLAVAGRDLWRDRASSRWPTVPGRITEVGVEKRRLHRRTVFVCRVAFRYVVDGAEYRSTQASFDDYWGMGPSEAAAATLATRYPEGKTVTVHYDPRQPERGVLEPGVPRAQIVLKAGMALVFLVVAAFVAL